jgi:hypothetical protein
MRGEDRAITSMATDRNTFRWLVPAVAFTIGLLAFLSGPPTFDAVDGAEFSVAGMRMELCHSPGYPLFLWLIRVTGMVSGSFDYTALRVLSSLLAALCVPAGFFALRRLGAGSRGSLLGTVIFLTLTPVFSQMNILEVHSLAVLMLLSAVALMHTRLAPYCMGMALFAGHPTSISLLPLAMSRRYRSWLVLLALIPLTMWLYVPIRAHAASVMHYAHPDTPARFLSYLRMYSENVRVPQLTAVLGALRATGIPGAVAIALGLVFAGRPTWRYVTAVAAGLVLLSSYAVGDITSLSWLLYLPLCAWSSVGFERLCSRRWGILLCTAVVLVSAVSGVYWSRRGDDSVAGSMSRDIMSSLSYRSVLCTAGHQGFYAAYLTQIEDRRPDLLMIGAFGNIFGMHIRSPYPAEIGGRPLYATRGWTESALRLNGVVFAPPDRQDPVDWSRFRVFGVEGYIFDGFSRDALADMWARRALQTEDQASADSFACRAMEWASTDMARMRISSILSAIR